MTEAVVAIEVDRPVSEVLDCFLHYPIHHLPVVRVGKLVGMLDSADVMKLEYFAPKSAVDRAAYLDERLTIAQLMQQSVLSLAPSTSVGEAAERMIDAGVHAAPVLDPAEHVIGLVTTSDVIRSLLHGPPRKGELPVSRVARALPAEDGQEQVRAIPGTSARPCCTSTSAAGCWRKCSSWRTASCGRGRTSTRTRCC